jgi:hypothetical protein
MKILLLKRYWISIVMLFFIQNISAQGAHYDTSFCPNQTVFISTENIFGSDYQWQLNTGHGFFDLTDDSNYTQSDIPSLRIEDIPSSWYGYEYRCIVDGVPDDSFTVHFATQWQGVTDNWSDVSNWSCGELPDANTDVIVDPAGDLVIVDIDAVCRSLKLNTNTSLQVDVGKHLIITH